MAYWKRTFNFQAGIFMTGARDNPVGACTNIGIFSVKKNAALFHWHLFMRFFENLGKFICRLRLHVPAIFQSRSIRTCKSLPEIFWMSPKKLINPLVPFLTLFIFVFTSWTFDALITPFRNSYQNGYPLWPREISSIFMIDFFWNVYW